MHTLHLRRFTVVASRPSGAGFAWTMVDTVEEAAFLLMNTTSVDPHAMPEALVMMALLSWILLTTRQRLAQ